MGFVLTDVDIDFYYQSANIIAHSLQYIRIIYVFYLQFFSPCQVIKKKTTIFCSVSFVRILLMKQFSLIFKVV